LRPVAPLVALVAMEAMEHGVAEAAAQAEDSRARLRQPEAMADLLSLS